MTCYAMVRGRENVYQAERNVRLRIDVRDQMENAKMKSDIARLEASVAGVGQDLDNIQRDLAGRFQVVRDDQNTIKGSLSSVSKLSENNRAGIRSLSLQTDRADDRLRHVVATQSRTEGRVESLSADLVNMRGVMVSTEEELRAADRVLAHELDGVRSLANKNEKGVQTVSRQVQDLGSLVKGEVERLNLADKVLGQQLADVCDRQAEVGDHLSMLDSEVDHLSLADELLALELEEVRDRQAVVVDHLSIVDREVEGLHSQLSAEVARLDANDQLLGHEVSTLSGNLDVLEDDLSELQGDLRDAVVRVGDLSNQQARSARELESLSEYREQTENDRLTQLRRIGSNIDGLMRSIEGDEMAFVWKWCKSEMNEAVAMLSKSACDCQNGMASEAAVMVGRASDRLMSLIEMAREDEEQYAERFQMVEILAMSMKANGCRGVPGMGRIYEDDVRSPFYVVCDLCSGKRVEVILPFRGKMKIRIHGVRSDREAHTSFDAIEAIYGKNGLIAEHSHCHGEEHMAESRGKAPGISDVSIA